MEDASLEGGLCLFCSAFPSPIVRNGFAQPSVMSSRRMPGAGGQADSHCSKYSLRLDTDSRGMCHWNGKQNLFVICYEAVMGTPVPLGWVFPASTRAQPLLPSLQVFPFLNSIMKSMSVSQFIFSFHPCWQGSAGA